MTAPRLLDLFCGAGGAAKGYQRAGFHVVGVDIRPQPNYCGDDFWQADALQVLRDGALILYDENSYGGWALYDFAAIHASPPCQRFSSFATLHPEREYPDLLTPARALLEETSLPWVIENVPGAPMRADADLCGSMFGLPFRRHRWFEFSWREPLLTLGCDHSQPIIGVYGASDGLYEDGFKHPGSKRGPRQGTTDEIREAMGMPWAKTRREITEAIPPAFTELIGHQLMQHVRSAVVSSGANTP